MIPPRFLAAPRQHCCLVCILPFVRIHLDICRRKKKNSRRYALYRTTDSISDSAHKIDRPLGGIGISAIEIDNHGFPVCHVFRNLTRIIKAARLGQNQFCGANCLTGRQCDSLRRFVLLRRNRQWRNRFCWLAPERFILICLFQRLI